MTQTRYSSSLDYLTLDITGPSVMEVESDIFQVCFSKSYQVPNPVTWLNATNNGDGTITILEGPGTTVVLTPGLWHIMVKVSDSPTIPIYYGGDVYILS